MTGSLPSPGLLALGLAFVFIAALIRGFTGFGFSIAAVPLLSLIVPPAQAVPIVLVLQLLVSVNGFVPAVRICDWRSVGWLALGAAVATPLGVWSLAHLPASPVRLCIAAIVLLAVLVLARGTRVGLVAGRGILPFGIVSGLFNGLAGMPGPPVIAFYLASPITTGVARASMIVFFLATSIFALIPLATLGMLGWPIAIMALAGFPAVWAGSWLGARMYRGSSDQRYRMVALALLIVTAILAAARAVLDLIAASA
ncbi:sulfite exporter TauE/SafE family protein [Acidisphaera sp. L21]|uniref:sulfite exporter TauE/SafE family protein n=1 Tax=Acidisphaera sp. L21 TaxID=1641851 RepID=UPI00131B7B0C|nr:sulfite exporter TauE/SafE family protein [Acidisphaera sp. L21]